MHSFKHLVIRGDELKNPTMTICHVPESDPAEAAPLARAALALTREPELPAEEVLDLFR